MPGLVYAATCGVASSISRRRHNTLLRRLQMKVKLGEVKKRPLFTMLDGRGMKSIASKSNYDVDMIIYIAPTTQAFSVILSYLLKKASDREITRLVKKLGSHNRHYQCSKKVPAVLAELHVERQLGTAASS